ncbi:MAG: hypothetical protein IPP90_05405 [Gemmatimonadaceae bacterium]|nr:hypothetical protein [Gemmatimonadaceae bacterium]
MRSRGRFARRVGQVASVLMLGNACRESPPDAAVTGRVADVPASRGSVDNLEVRDLPPDSALRALWGAGARYVVVTDTSALHGGTIVGTLEAPAGLTGDSAITPTHDLNVCKPFTDTRTPSQDGGAGNAVVWLVGVTTGPPLNASRRAALTLDRCRLEPRVQRMALGGTLQVTSRDAMSSRLRFVDVGDATTIRAQVMLTDAGQVVPTGEVAATAGLVEVRDDKHPWVRAFIAVAPHPFVAITSSNGTFRFDSVPEGTYTLVVWQEQLGVRTQVLQVHRGVEVRVRMKYLVPST